MCIYNNIIIIFIFLIIYRIKWVSNCNMWVQFWLHGKVVFIGTLKTSWFHFNGINSIAETCTAATTSRQSRWHRRKFIGYREFIHFGFNRKFDFCSFSSLAVVIVSYNYIQPLKQCLCRCGRLLLHTWYCAVSFSVMSITKYKYFMIRWCGFIECGLRR